MGTEHQLIGIPGAGKTSLLINKILPDVYQKYGGEKIIVTSFSKNGAQNIAMKMAQNMKGSHINPDHVNTTHSLCYHMMGNPKIADENVEEFNNAQNNDDMIIQPSKNSSDFKTYRSVIDPLSRLNFLRSRMVDPSTYPKTIKVFEKKWNEYKKDNDYADYTDLIEYCVNNKPFGPGNPEAIIIDEAQDSSPLQMKLLRQWAVHAKELYVCGDDQQTLYVYLGCHPDSFLNKHIEEKNKIKLQRSYRVPRKILMLGKHVIDRATPGEPRQYLPRIDQDGKEVEGEIIPLNATVKAPLQILDHIKESISENKTIMILAQCGYMLKLTMQMLRDNGIAYHNPYKPKQYDWNPLAPRPGQVTSSSMLSDFLDTGDDELYWTVPQLLGWIKDIKTCNTGLIRKQGQQVIKFLDQAIKDNSIDMSTTRDVLDQILSPDAIEPALSRDTRWLTSMMKSSTSRKKTIDFPLAIYKNYGFSHLNSTPNTVIGTIHSVKGAEAQHVFLFPEISWSAGLHARKNVEDRDSIYRTFYVAITRASEKLYLCKPTMQKNRAGTHIKLDPTITK